MRNRGGLDEAGVSASSRAVVDLIADSAVRAGAAAAERYELLDRLRVIAAEETGAAWTSPDDLAWRDLRAEVAAALRIGERAAHTQLDLARRLVHDFPRTLAALRIGDLPETHARALVHESCGLATPSLKPYEDQMLRAKDLGITRFERLAQRVRASLEPEALIERHREAVQERRVGLEAAPDGMAWYGALLPAQEAVGAAAAVTGLARALKVEGETRTLSQLEADVFRDLILDAVGAVPPAMPGAAVVPSPAARRGVRPEVLLQVPVLTAMGLDNAPGALDGYGPVDAETARELCAQAPGFIRILTDPADGATRSFGRTTYRVPAELKRFLRARDEVCRFVGCSRSAALCDIDHTVPWHEHGETVEANLAHLCRGHHRLKERGRWRVRHDPGGVLSWTSPTGRTYQTKPAPRPRPRVGAPPKPMTGWLVVDRDEPPGSGAPPF